MMQRCSSSRSDGKPCNNRVRAGHSVCYLHGNSAGGEASDCSAPSVSSDGPCTIRVRDGHLWCETHFDNKNWAVAGALGAAVPCDLLGDTPKYAGNDWLTGVCSGPVPDWFIDLVLDGRPSEATLRAICSNHGSSRAFMLASPHCEYYASMEATTSDFSEAVSFLIDLLGSAHCPDDVYRLFLDTLDAENDVDSGGYSLLDSLATYLPQHILQEALNKEYVWVSDALRVIQATWDAPIA